MEQPRTIHLIGESQRFYTKTHAHYCGIDLHAKTMYLCILDKNGVTGKNPTGGGIAGENWILPLCDYEPPIHLRSPEYVTTGRGEEWWIPAMPD